MVSTNSTFNVELEIDIFHQFTTIGRGAALLRYYNNGTEIPPPSSTALCHPNIEGGRGVLWRHFTVQANLPVLGKDSCNAGLQVKNVVIL